MVVHAVGLPAGTTLDDLDPAMLGDAVNLKAGGFLRLWKSVRDSIVPGARMIAIGGHLGVEPSEHAPLAGVANAALANLVRQLVGPVGRRGGTVHLVAPGPFESPRVDALITRAAAARGLSSDEVRAQMLAEYPTGRMPSAADVAALIVGLAAPPNSAQNGSTIFADGGIKRSIF
jgi:NAD(P)-dependent dehydrogenase (short-subunit alcohol dehydrogenase family)